ncbi:MAG: SapC family protein, partial [Pseudomonadota bacterium]
MKRELQELNQNLHGQLKVAPNAVVSQAAQQHMIGLKISEVGQALAEFPVFFTKLEEAAAQGRPPWSISAITSLEPNKNLFVHEEQWDACYTPSAMRTYPMHLMSAGEGKEGYSVGIDPQSNAFTEGEGHDLFDEDGKATVYLSRVT